MTEQMTQPTQQFKFMEVTYTMTSVFMIPANWDENRIRIRGDTLYYKNKWVLPIIEDNDTDNYETEITADGENHLSDEWTFEDYLYEIPKKEVKIEK